MARYSVWVSGEGGKDRVQLVETDDVASLQEAVQSLLGWAEAANFDLGISLRREEGGHKEHETEEEHPPRTPVHKQPPAQAEEPQAQRQPPPRPRR